MQPSPQVQKVYFRDSTVQEAKRLGLVGWVANTLRGTVVGECQGPAAALGEMKVGLWAYGVCGCVMCACGGAGL